MSIDPVASERNPDGSWSRVRVDLLGEDGEERHFWLSGRQLDDRKIRQLVKAIDDAGGVQSPGYPVAILAHDDDVEEAA